MDRPVQLIPLVCTQCSTQIPAEADEVAWACKQCGTGMYLDLQAGLQPLEIHYGTGIQPNTRGLPFWMADGQVTLQRDTYSGNQAREAEEYWSQPRRFFIPAYSCALDGLLSAGTYLLDHPPALVAGPAVDFEPVTLSKEDVFAAAEFIVLSIEANRKDKLKQVRFQLQLTNPVLWVLARA